MRSTERLSVKEVDGYSSVCYLVRNILTPIVPIEQQLETARQELAKRRDFTLTAAFQRFAANL